MRVRDAVASDAEAVGAVTGAPTAAARELLRARTVRVAEADDAVDGDTGGEGAGRDDGEDHAELVGVVAFDARPGVVHVTRLAGTRAAMERLLEEPLDFAARETMVVEVVLPAGDTATEVVSGRGFEDAGPGPRFGGEETRRFRLEPTG